MDKSRGIRNEMRSKVCDEIFKSIPNPQRLNCTVEVRGRLSNFVPHFIMDIITYISRIRCEPMRYECAHSHLVACDATSKGKLSVSGTVPTSPGDFSEGVTRLPGFMCLSLASMCWIWCWLSLSLSVKGARRRYNQGPAKQQHWNDLQPCATSTAMGLLPWGGGGGGGTASVKVIVRLPGARWL